jgi:CubicO group peptidase (beta-lactamase class C family)
MIQKFIRFEKVLKEKIESHLPGVTPGLVLQVYFKGKKVGDISCGQTYPYYDLASLTKIIFTVPLLMKSFDKGIWDLDTPVSQVCDWLKYRKIRISEILTHTSGLPGWSPFYKMIDLSLDLNSRWNRLSALINEMELDPLNSVNTFQGKRKSVYSDVGFLVLARFLQQRFDRSLIELWQEVRESFYPGLESLEFHPEHKFKYAKELYAPTERCPWRGRLLQGEVHDENAWALDGVSTHSGLFGSVDDVSSVGLFYRSQKLGLSRLSFKAKTIKLFTSRAVDFPVGDWGLGFMLPTPNRSSAGKYFSLFSFGHTGFTGTSLWFDPESDIMVTLLSNRLQYGRSPNHFKDLRSKIHDWVCEEVKHL